MTNFEKIKTLSIDEMAEFINQNPFCALEHGDVDCIYGWHGPDCAKHAKCWLESEADSNKNQN